MLHVTEFMMTCRSPTTNNMRALLHAMRPCGKPQPKQNQSLKSKETKRKPDLHFQMHIPHPLPKPRDPSSPNSILL